MLKVKKIISICLLISLIITSFPLLEKVDAAQTPGIVDGGVYELKNVGSGKYLNVHMGYDVDTTNVYQWTRDYSTEQKFKVVYISATDSYRFYAMCSSGGTNRVLDIVKSGGTVQNGCNVEIYRPVDPIAQEWKIINVGTAGRYKVVPRTNTAVALTAYGTQNGTATGKSPTSAGNVFVSTCSGNGTSNQQWDFVYQGVDDHSDTASGATTVTVGGYKDGILNNGTDQDWFKFYADSSGTYVIKTTGTTDTYGRLYQGTSTYLTANNDSGAGTNFQISRTISTIGWYYVKVTGNNSAVGSYTIYAIKDDHPNSETGATTINLGSSKVGLLNYIGDEDWFNISHTQASPLAINVQLNLPGDTNYDLRVYEGIGGTQVASGNNGVGQTENVSFIAKENIT